MPTIPANVIPRAVLTPDVDGKYLLTPGLVNDMARPIVSVTIAESDLYPAALITINKVGTTTSVTIQMQLSGSNIGQRFRIQAWLSENNTDLGISSNEPSSPATGWVGNQATIITDANGLYSTTFTHVGVARTWYLCISTATGFISVSEAIAYA